ncbi:MAG: Calx-beta domain-containing protein [Acidimicrobiales bacterium]|nr:Calx-beta domain-containing protein [Acidimicrobiales bacterium]
MTLSRNQLFGIIVVFVLVLGVIAAWQITGDDGGEEAKDPPLVNRVTERTLRDELTINGELRRDELSTINSPFDGRVSQLSVEDGDDVSAGDVLLGLDGRPAVAVNGDFSFYRELDVGTDGPDVLQLERILFESGYDPGAIDTLYTEATRSALRQWQIAYGYGGATPEPEETIVVTLAESNGYTIADLDTTAIIIGPSVPGQVGGTDQPALVPTAGGAGLVPFQVPDIPRIGVSSSTGSVTEGGTLDVILVSDPAPTVDTEFQVEFGGDATGGTAEDVADPDEDVDYLNEPLEDSTFIIWPAGESTLTLELQTIADDLDEDDETWSLTLIGEQVITGNNYDIGPLKTIEVDILDTNDPKIPTLRLYVDTEEEDEVVDEGGAATFTIESDIELDVTLEVRYEVIGGTAVEEDDYDEQDERATFDFGANDTIDTFTIGTTQDDDVEPDETITVTLLPADDPDNQYFLTSEIAATITIEDEDEPELSMITREQRIPEGSLIQLIIEADQAPKEDISVDYTIDGSATMGVDFEVLTGTVTYPRGRTRVALTIQTIDDDVLFVPSDMIVADWPARVGTVFVDEGETVQLGQGLLTLTEPDFTIRLFANPTDRSELAVGQVVQVEIEAGDQDSSGIITQLDDAATISDSGNESYEGVVEVDDDLAAVDGATVRIEVILEERVNAVTVPIAAISLDGTGNEVVQVFDPETNSVTPTQIVTGLQEGSFTEVVSGLDGDELVIVNVDN